MSIACSLGIMAYNEEANIGRMLGAVVSQRLTTVNLTEILVVASGCTDRTESVVHDWTRRDPRIRLIVQLQREGKASAVNEFLPQAREKIVVICSADLVPEAGAIEELVAPFADPAVGMTTGRPVPVNDPGTFMGFAAHSARAIALSDQFAPLQSRRDDRIPEYLRTYSLLHRGGRGKH